MIITGNGRTSGEFYMGFFKGSRSPPVIMLMTSEQHPVSYYIEAPGAGFYRNGTIVPNNETIVHIPYSLIVDSYSDKTHGIYVKTESDRVTVIGRVGDYKRRIRNAEVYASIPVTNLNINEYEYFALSVNSSSMYRDSIVLVVGTENDTSMKLTVTQEVTVSIDDFTTSLIPDKEYSFVINRLQTVYMESNDELTGTRIVTNKPITHLSGHECTAVPWNGGRCSHLIEQIPPTALWGKLHYISPFATFRSGYAVKIVASKHCKIYMYCSELEVWTVTLNSGESMFKMFLNNEPCAVHSTEKILVAQFSLSQSYTDYYNHSSPVMVIVPPTDQYYSNFLFSPTDYTENVIYSSYTLVHHVNIIVLAQYYQPDMIYLISGGVNKSLNTQEWIPVKVNNITEAYTTQVNNISNSMVDIVHTNRSALMTIITYGLMQYGGYGSAIIHPHGKGVVDLSYFIIVF